MQTGISSTAPSYMSLPLLAMLLENLRQGQVLTSAAHQGRQTTEIGRSRGATERNDRQQGVTTMAASAILLVDDAQGSCTSLSEVIWDLDYQESGAYDGPAVRELSRPHTSNLAFLDYKSPGTGGVEPSGQVCGRDSSRTAGPS